MSRAFFSPAARRDLLEILEYISRDKPGAAIRQVERIEAASVTLASNPQLGAARDDIVPQLRAWPVGSYVILYRMIENDIEVIRVVHGARDFSKLFE